MFAYEIDLEEVVGTLDGLDTRVRIADVLLQAVRVFLQWNPAHHLILDSQVWWLGLMV